MPCSSEHLEPTAREVELKNVAQLLVKMMKLVGVGVPIDLSQQAKHVYGEGPHDVDHLTAKLCELCDMHEGVIKHASGQLNEDALAIARWWVGHRKHDVKQGRKRALSDEQVGEIRHQWDYNTKQWQLYRRNPQRYDEPQPLTLSDLARRYKVSPGVISDVIDKKGAYNR